MIQTSQPYEVEGGTERSTAVFRLIGETTEEIEPRRSQGASVVEQNDMPSAIRIFVSCSHKDKDQKNEVIACLGALPPDGVVASDWKDTNEHWHAVEIVLRKLVRELGATDKQRKEEPRIRRCGHNYLQQGSIDTVDDRGFRAKLKAAPTESLPHEN